MRLTIFLFISGIVFAQTATATEYIHRELMANTLPTAGCTSAAEATANALKPYNLNRSSKKFCQMQGYGWHLEEIKSNGKPVCKPCKGAADASLSQCYLEDMVVICKRIKPGSVGMLPGKG